MNEYRWQSIGVHSEGKHLFLLQKMANPGPSRIRNKEREKIIGQSVPSVSAHLMSYLSSYTLKIL